MADEEVLLTEKELAKILKKSPSTLRSQRSRGRGVPFHKIDGSIRYLKADVEAYIAKGKVIPGSHE